MSGWVLPGGDLRGNTTMLLVAVLLWLGSSFSHRPVVDDTDVLDASGACLAICITDAPVPDAAIKRLEVVIPWEVPWSEGR